MLEKNPHAQSLAKLMSELQTAELTELFRLLSDGSRLRILLTCLDRPLAVGDIATDLKLSPSLVSHHLRLLRASRLVSASRSGRKVFYTVTDEHIRRVLSDMVEHVVFG
jgi:ArsR family transcriptional regulator, lead/cadmium/zinc/bismuth-responsive transcriptional repressor